MITTTLPALLAACSWEAQFTFVNASSQPIDVVYSYTTTYGVDCVPKLGVSSPPGLPGGGGFVSDAPPAAHQDAVDAAGVHTTTLRVSAGASVALCNGVNSDFDREPPVQSVDLRTADGVELLSVSQAGLGAVFKSNGSFLYIWRYAG